MNGDAHKCWCGRELLCRVELPQRRGGENFDFSVGHTSFTASIRRASPKATITEVFVNSTKIDSDVDLVMRDAAVVISIALQYGVPIAAFGSATGRNVDGKASSPIGAILDILLREENGHA